MARVPTGGSSPASAVFNAAVDAPRALPLFVWTPPKRPAVNRTSRAHMLGTSHRLLDDVKSKVISPLKFAPVLTLDGLMIVVSYRSTPLRRDGRVAPCFYP